MYSLLQLKSNCEKQLDSKHLDYDLKANMTASDIAYWCREYLSIHQNIEETSISKSHQVERRKKLIDSVLSR